VNQKHLKNSYSIINLAIIGIILSIIIYSLLYSAEGRQHPIPSGTVMLSGQSSPSTGLSRSFSEIVRFDFRQAGQYNPYGIRIFMFFLIQLVMRVLALTIVLRGESGHYRVLIITDISLSVMLFLVCFQPFLLYLIRQIT
jgi:hypothetical protein